MMGLRADTTPQVARIATTRLARAPRPLRLSYAGQCLRVRGSQLAPDRQIAQAGIELIGCDSPAADAEIVLVGAEALAAVGLTRISFDLTLPTLVPVLLDDAGIDGPDRATLGARAGPQGRRLGGAPRRRSGADADRTAAGRRSGRPRAGGAGGSRLPLAARDLARRLAAAVAAIRARAPDAAPDHRSGRVPRLPLRDRRLGHDLRPRPARGAGPRRALYLRRGGAGDRPDAVPGCACCAPHRRARHASDCTCRSAPTPTRPRACGVWAMPRSRRWSAGRRSLPRRRAALLCSHILRERQRRTPDLWNADAMANVAVIGAQWGDEGKGKVVDWLASRADIVVRFQGGHNAGHTLVVGNETYKLSLLPSGLVRGKIGIIGNGVVVDPEALLAEIEKVRAQGLDVTPASLRIAENATLILPMHPALDRAREAARGDRKIGTTGRGIGPAYEDKVARRAIRVADLAEPETLARQAGRAAAASQHAAARAGCRDICQGGRAGAAAALAPKVLPFAEPVWERLDEARRAGRRILFEGAQAVMLDVDHGTYPYVTSSNTVAATAASGAGVGPAAVGFVLGIAKAYTTRVGSGPFPTELTDATGQLLGDRGNEFGTEHRPPPALRLVRRGAGAPGGEGRRHPWVRADQAGRAGRAAGAEDLHRLSD